VVERREEHVHPLETFDGGLGCAHVGHVGHCSAQAGTEPLEDGGLLHEATELLGQHGDDLVSHVVRHVPVIGGELEDVSVAIRLVLQRQPGELQGGGPPFGAHGQVGDIAFREVEAQSLVEQGCGLQLVEAQLVHADLAKLAAGTQPRQLQWRVVP
jgi:hypothetical protein